jgi:hypothetical protein
MLSLERRTPQQIEQRKPITQKIKTAVENTVNFVRVSPHLHLEAMVTGSLAHELFNGTIDGFNEGNVPKAVIGGVGATAVTLFTALNEADAIRNHDNYTRFKKVFAKRGVTELIFDNDEPFWCDRFAALVAAEDTGHGKELRELYKRRGYSWKKI